MIPSIGTLTEAKKKAQAQLDLDSYFDVSIRIATSTDLATSANTMHQYVVGLATLKTMMHILLDDFNRRAKPVYPDATEARVCFQKDVTTKYIDIIADYRAWH